MKISLWGCFLTDLFLSSQEDVPPRPFANAPLSLCIILRDEGFFVLEPKELKRITFQSGIPSEVQGNWCEVFVFETLLTAWQNIAIGVRTGVFLFVIPCIRKEAKILIKVGKEADGGLILSVQNRGNVRARGRRSGYENQGGETPPPHSVPSGGFFPLLYRGSREISNALVVK
ncbi:MAG: hypothetical protein HPY68_10785 [Candidatus Atribacteria bacterium]|nr:hypothetical protein [Candidatus Atribacteria bacterium]